MAKKNAVTDPRFTKLLDLMKKYQDDQGDTDEKLHIKRIVMALPQGRRNPCSGKQCEDGKHPEIYMDFETGDLSCRCVR